MSGYQHWHITQLLMCMNLLMIRPVYDQIKFVRDANQYHWLHDCKTLAMTQRDLNYLTKWVDDIKAAHPIRNNEEVLKVP